MVNNLEIEIKKQDDGYSVFSEDDDKKRIYTIFSPKLKQKMREIIFPFGTSNKENDQYQGKSSQGDNIFYQQGKENIPDQLTLISVNKYKEITDKTEHQQKEEDGWENWDAEWEKAEALWKKTESELGMPSGGTRHYFSGRNSDGEIVMEGICMKSENQPLIQEITEEEVKKIRQENDNSKQIFFQQQQFIPKK
jgi:hypothetical protein